MSQPRVDIYNFPHKGLRNLLSQVSFMAGNTDHSNQQALDELKTKTAELVLLLNLHRHSEEEDVLPALEAKVPGSTRDNVEEHELIEKTVEQISDFLSRLTVEASPVEGVQFSSILSGFHAKYLDHMAMEESKMNPIIWNHFTDEELMGMHGAVMSKLAPGQIVLWFKYIVPALNPMERNIILSGFKANAPLKSFLIRSWMSFVRKCRQALLMAWLPLSKNRQTRPLPEFSST